MRIKSVVLLHGLLLHGNIRCTCNVRSVRLGGSCVFSSIHHDLSKPGREDCGSLAIKILRKVTIVALASLANIASAAESATADPLFLSDDTLDVTLTAPLTTLVKERPKEDYLAGTFQFQDSDGSDVEFDIRIRTRGNFRHKNCKYPPLSLNFKRKQAKESLFDEQNKLKLVVHCKDSERYQQMVLREYLAYKILNVLTNMSFRARLLRVTYVDSEQSRDGQVHYAFLIEHKNRLADRYGLNALKIERTTVNAIQADRLNLTSIFAYLIGNTDFSPIAGPADDKCCHNYVLFGNGAEQIVAIPYDFDQSGLVDAPYAEPNHRFGIRSVRQRVYRGRCVNNEHVVNSLAELNEHREEIYALVAAQEGLDDNTRARVVRYIDSFYKLIDDPRNVERRIINRCI